MTTLTIEERGNPAKEAEVAELESRFGSQLPRDYRGFLLANNGGYPVPDAFKFQGANTGSTVQGFYSVSGPHREDRFSRVLEVYADRVPRSLLPFAYDPGGNLLCIRCSGPGTGKVYFWDHEQEAEEGEAPGDANLRLVAESFTEFLASLYAFSG